MCLREQLDRFGADDWDVPPGTGEWSTANVLEHIIAADAVIAPRTGELGMRPLVAHCYLGLGKLYRRTGRRDEAQGNLTTATTMYREMDMRF